MPDFVVTAKVQVVVQADDNFSARYEVTELLDILIGELPYGQDPMCGRLIESVVDVSADSGDDDDV